MSETTKEIIVIVFHVFLIAFIIYIKVRHIKDEDDDTYL
jgi:hypothetical protein